MLSTGYVFRTAKTYQHLSLGTCGHDQPKDQPDKSNKDWLCWTVPKSVLLHTISLKKQLTAEFNPHRNLLFLLEPACFFLFDCLFTRLGLPCRLLTEAAHTYRAFSLWSVSQRTSTFYWNKPQQVFQRLYNYLDSKIKRTLQFQCSLTGPTKREGNRMHVTKSKSLRQMEQSVRQTLFDKKLSLASQPKVGEYRENENKSSTTGPAI